MEVQPLVRPLSLIGCSVAPWPNIAAAASSVQFAVLLRNEDAALGGLLRAIAAYCGDAAFSTRALVAHAQTMPALSAAIVSVVGILNARAVGKALKRVEGVAMDDLPGSTPWPGCRGRDLESRVVHLRGSDITRPCPIPSAVAGKVGSRRRITIAVGSSRRFC